MPGIDEQIISSLQVLIKNILDEEDFDLAELQFKRAKSNYMLKVFIDTKTDIGISINDCERVSKRLSNELDAMDFIPGPYVLEVSSPGLDRNLKEEKDFIRYTGKKVKVRLNTKDNRKQSVEGKIISCKDSILIIEDSMAEKHTIPFVTIIKAKLVIEF